MIFKIIKSIIKYFRYKKNNKNSRIKHIVPKEIPKNEAKIKECILENNKPIIDDLKNDFNKEVNLDFDDYIIKFKTVVNNFLVNKKLDDIWQRFNEYYLLCLEILDKFGSDFLKKLLLDSYEEQNNKTYIKNVKIYLFNTTDENLSSWVNNKLGNKLFKLFPKHLLASFTLFESYNKLNKILEDNNYKNNVHKKEIEDNNFHEILKMLNSINKKISDYNKYIFEKNENKLIGDIGEYLSFYSFGICDSVFGTKNIDTNEYSIREILKGYKTSQNIKKIKKMYSFFMPDAFENFKDQFEKINITEEIQDEIFKKIILQSLFIPANTPSENRCNYDIKMSFLSNVKFKNLYDVEKFQKDLESKNIYYLKRFETRLEVKSTSKSFYSFCDINLSKFLDELKNIKINKYDDEYFIENVDSFVLNKYQLNDLFYSRKNGNDYKVIRVYDIDHDIQSLFIKKDKLFLDCILKEKLGISVSDLEQNINDKHDEIINILGVNTLFIKIMAVFWIKLNNICS